MKTTRQHNTAADAAPVHIPVMLDEVLAALQPKDGGVYVDGTFGAGGYTRAILEAADCTVYGIDRDPEAILRAKALKNSKGGSFEGRLIPLHGCFGDVEALLDAAGVEAIDGFVLDLGVSSIQLSTPGRGFSFMHDGPLDMRMSLSGISARDVVNDADEKDLADIIFTYGEERASRAIARKIISARAEKPIETTKELVSVIHSVLPMHGGIKTDTATRTFQALRIYVNDELGELERALDAGERLLKKDGRLVAVSFHSLEDWRVKNFFKEKSGRASNTSRHLPARPDDAKPSFTLEENNGVKPTDAEIARNARSRSARLRYGIRTAAPVMEDSHA
ncbi:MAG: 16S rRNA (cytosine(1402)-N(4))-methyltransferase RsmH [Micavibrio sp.]|nr:16S rRNA (cytosine(1402)-N(4))-methyltransferase RsmH [Micavibrio sp.]